MPKRHPLKRYRLERGLKLGDMSALFRVTKMTASRWERGTLRISVKQLPRIAALTGIPTKKLRPDLAKLFGAAE